MSNQKRKSIPTEDTPQKGKKSKTEEEEVGNCIICLETFKEDHHCCTLSCGHVFHSECIWPWLIEHKTCPICRDGTMRCQHYKEEKKEDSLWFIAQHSHTDIAKTIVTSLTNEITLLKKKLQEQSDHQMAVSLTNPITMLFDIIR
jgi:hypothetical protein